MAITVQMIENKEFPVGPMGYKRRDVDEFLDEICDEMVRLNEEIQTLQLKLSQANQQPAASPYPGQRTNVRPGVSVPAPLEIEPEPRQEEASAPAPAAERKEPIRPDIGSEAAAMLRTAQRVYDETIRDAKDEAKRILDGAQEKIDNQLKLQQQEREETEEALHALRQSALDYKKKLQNLLNSQQKLLDDADEIFKEDP